MSRPSEVVEVVFSVIAETSLGSEIRVVGSSVELGSWDPSSSANLRTDASQYPRWSGAVRFPRALDRVEYKFIKVLPDSTVWWEETDNRSFSCRAIGSRGSLELRTISFGQATTSRPASCQRSRPGSSSPIRAAIYSGPSLAPPVGARSGDKEVVVKFEATCRFAEYGQTLVIVGSADALGCWDPDKGLQLTTSAGTFPAWVGSARLRSRDTANVEWKLVLRKPCGAADWENGPNRQLQLPQGAVGSDDSVSTYRVHAAFGGGPCGPAQLVQGDLEPSPQNSRAPRVVTSSKTTDRSPPKSLARKAPVATGAAGGEPCGCNGVGPGPCSTDPVDLASWKRSSSMTFLTTDVAFGGQLEGLGQRGRAMSCGDDQNVVFKVAEVAPEVAERMCVEVVFKEDGSDFRLALEPVSTTFAPGPSTRRWSLNLQEAQRQFGLHLFHFTVNGVRQLSSEHTVLGEWNAILYSESMRRYICSRDSSGMETPHVPAGRSCTMETIGANNFAPSFCDDSGLKTGDRQQIARPWSIAHNLVGLGDDGEDENAMNMKGAFANFGKEVYEGLYDGELRLRADGFELLEPSSYESASTASQSKPMKLQAGAHMLKKKLGACEDAYFVGSRALGVADGVGCMVQFASYGINAAEYARELMEHASQHLENLKVRQSDDGVPMSMEARAADAIRAAEHNATAYGASTITVLAMEGRTAGVANLGDSGFILLRKGPRGMYIVARSEEQQHSWNCPYQLTRLPQVLLNRFPKLSLDTAENSELYSFALNVGDLLLVFSDGLRDNLHDREILHIVDCALSPAFGDLIGLPGYATPPETVARALALAAQERSLDPAAKVPFNEYSKKYGYDCSGGKQDDITVVAAWVCEDDQGQPREPISAADLPPPPLPVPVELPGNPDVAGAETTLSQPQDLESAGTVEAAAVASAPADRTIAAPTSPVSADGSGVLLEPPPAPTNSPRVTSARRDDTSATAAARSRKNGTKSPPPPHTRTPASSTSLVAKARLNTGAVASGRGYDVTSGRGPSQQERQNVFSRELRAVSSGKG